MIITFDRSFSKWIGKVKNQKVKDLTIEFIGQMEHARAIEDLSSIKKLKGSKIAYRKRIGDYRIGFEHQKGKVHFVIIGHRKDIYKNFP